MPTYQYACTECGHGFEAVQSFTDAALTECPQCTGRLRKVFNSVGIVFKGSGFYRTDSREGVKASQNGSADKAPAETKSDSTKSTADTSSTSTSASGGTSAAPASSSSTKGSAA